MYHSATKFLGGHGVAIGGILVDGGNFDWVASGKFPELTTEPYAGFHGMNFSEESTVAAFLLRARREGLRDFGACMSPATAFQILQGRRDPAAEDAAPRREHPQGGGTSGHASGGRIGVLPRTARTSRLRTGETPAAQGLRRGFQLLVKGDRAAGRRFVESLKIFSHLANVGDAKSLVIHPASTTHFRMDDAALEAAGITEGTMRLSIGLEDADDLIDDLGGGLRASQKTK